MKVYQEIASALQAMWNCEKTGNTEWLEKHRERIQAICKNHLPSGSGVDSGTEFDFADSKPNRLVFNTSYHHMNDAGMYDGWTTHRVIVTPDLASPFNLNITGRDRNDIKEYLAQLFHFALSEELGKRHVASAAE